VSFPGGSTLVDDLSGDGGFPGSGKSAEEMDGRDVAVHRTSLDGLHSHNNAGSGHVARSADTSDKAHSYEEVTEVDRGGAVPQRSA
jgi:hypothetical protein